MKARTVKGMVTTGGGLLQGEKEINGFESMQQVRQDTSSVL